MSGWRPLLDGEDAVRAREAVAAIHADLHARPPVAPSLDGGDAGTALLGAYLSLAGDEDAGDRAVDALERAMDGIADVPTPWVLNGFTGIAWTIAHLAPHVNLEESTLDELDALVGSFAMTTPWPSQYEYVGGLIGLGVYALERRSDAAQAMLVRMVEHLAGSAERDADGITWRSPPDLLSHWPELAARYQDGYYNLGLAHGVVGVAAFLAGAVRRGVVGARELLDGCVAWIRAQDRRTPDVRIPSMLVADRGASRDGWCYGDQAAATALLEASAAAGGVAAWREHALDLARAVVTRTPFIALHADFCHGTAGRAHMFNRVAQATGDEELAEAARTWYRETLTRRVPEKGIGGYESADGPRMATSILVGATGVALCLAAAVSPVEPAWDRAFLVSVAGPGIDHG
jgi:lantibiotic modifying enzyme